MLEAGDLNKLFRDCMPLFIALGDEVRLSIIGVLAGSGLYDDYETVSYTHLVPASEGEGGVTQQPV